MFEAVGAYNTGQITKRELNSVEEMACPTCGSCSGMYTANTMNCLTEALGMGLPGNGTVPAVFSERARLAKKSRNANYGSFKSRFKTKRYFDKRSV